jgi:Zn-dependent M32 family carboxypeptidase
MTNSARASEAHFSHHHMALLPRASDERFSNFTTTAALLWDATKPPAEEYVRFEQLARQVIAVPKKALDKRQAEYQRERKKGARKKKMA